MTQFKGLYQFTKSRAADMKGDDGDIDVQPTTVKRSKSTVKKETESQVGNL